MNSFLELKNSLLKELQNVFLDDNITILPKYNNNSINKLNQVISVGFSDINIHKDNSDSFAYNLIKINCCIDIYVKSILNTADCCYEILSKLYRFLNQNKSFDLNNICCKEIKFDELTEFYVLPIIAQFDVLVNKEE